jgi:hypothetical protein
LPDIRVQEEHARQSPIREFIRANPLPAGIGNSKFILYLLDHLHGIVFVDRFFTFDQVQVHQIKFASKVPNKLYAIFSTVFFGSLLIEYEFVLVFSDDCLDVGFEVRHEYSQFLGFTRKTVCLVRFANLVAPNTGHQLFVQAIHRSPTNRNATR